MGKSASFNEDVGYGHELETDKVECHYLERAIAAQGDGIGNPHPANPLRHAVYHSDPYNRDDKKEQRVVRNHLRRL